LEVALSLVVLLALMQRRERERGKAQVLPDSQ
jgi:hypothetical protein